MLMMTIGIYCKNHSVNVKTSWCVAVLLVLGDVGHCGLWNKEWLKFTDTQHHSTCVFLVSSTKPINVQILLVVNCSY